MEISLQNLGSNRPVRPNPAVMVWDGASFHTSRSLFVPENITLVQLPPYIPERNPIENLWHYLKNQF